MPKKVTIADLKKEIDSWEKSKYCHNYRALQKLFRSNEFSDNTCLENVIIKASALNDLYSTNIFSIYYMAKHITEIEDINCRLASGDHGLVNCIAKIQINDKEKRFYSFASKYCSFHNEDSFPIYDQYVEKMLKHYGAKGNLKDYGDFCSAIDTFKKGNGLDSCSLKDIDIYLWMKGKSL